MELNDFIANFANQFDETEPSDITANTVYRGLDEWSSLLGMAILNMIDKKYGVKINQTEIKGTTTVKDLYNLVESKL